MIGEAGAEPGHGGVHRRNAGDQFAVGVELLTEERHQPIPGVAHCEQRFRVLAAESGDEGQIPGHHEFGEGTVSKVTGEGSKRIAHVRFDNFGDKKLLIKIAPIAKLENLS